MYPSRYQNKCKIFLSFKKIKQLSNTIKMAKLASATAEAAKNSNELDLNKAQSSHDRAHKNLVPKSSVKSEKVTFYSERCFKSRRKEKTRKEEKECPDSSFISYRRAKYKKIKMINLRDFFV